MTSLPSRCRLCGDRKRNYQLEDEARQAVIDVHRHYGMFTQVYRCPADGGWHLTDISKKLTRRYELKYTTEFRNHVDQVAWLLILAAGLADQKQKSDVRARLDAALPVLPGGAVSPTGDHEQSRVQRRTRLDRRQGDQARQKGTRGTAVDNHHRRRRDRSRGRDEVRRTIDESWYD